nr:unnamed protein product [Callosobruchus chinensis]
MGDTTFTDKRSNNKPSIFTNEDRQLIHQHINSIPRNVSHYSRAKLDKQFLSPDLNIHQLFHRPRVDTCHTCDRLSCESKQNNSAGIKASIQLDIHHRKVQKSMEYMKKKITDSQIPGSDQCCISFDLQQVLFVSTLTHSDMFYMFT